MNNFCSLFETLPSRTACFDKFDEDDIGEVSIPWKTTFTATSEETRQAIIERIVDRIMNTFYYPRLDNAMSVPQDEFVAQGSTISSAKSIRERIIVEEADINNFIDLVDISCLETGYISRAEMFINTLCEDKGEAYIVQMMNDIYVRYPQNELLMCAIINILSNIDYDKIGSFAVTLCMALLKTGTPLVQEYVINACDSWKSKDFIECLRSVSTVDSFLLKRMIDKVIHRLEAIED